MPSYCVKLKRTSDSFRASFELDAADQAAAESLAAAMAVAGGGGFDAPQVAICATYAPESHTHAGVYLTQAEADALYQAIGQGGGGTWTTVKKTADTGRTNNALSADPHLSFAMAGSTKYAVRGKVLFDTNATADFKWRHTGPALPTLVRINRDWIVPGTTVYAGIAVDTAFSAADLAILTTGTNGGLITFEGVVHVGVAGGTFAFAWAQNTTNIGAATVRAGSYLEYAAF